MSTVAAAATRLHLLQRPHGGSLPRGGGQHRGGLSLVARTACWTSCRPPTPESPHRVTKGLLGCILTQVCGSTAAGHVLRWCFVCHADCATVPLARCSSFGVLRGCSSRTWSFPKGGSSSEGVASGGRPAASLLTGCSGSLATSYWPTSRLEHGTLPSVARNLTLHAAGHGIPRRGPRSPDG